jgi:HEAT repeat protein
MTATRLARLGCLLVVIATTHAQTAQRTPSIQEFYQTLLDHYEPSSPYNLPAVIKVTNQIAGARPEEINKALPAILAALAHQDKKLKDAASTALYMIAQRPDGATLLKSHIDAIGNELLNSPIPETRTGAMIILGSLKPVPPREVVPIFLAFLKRTDPESEAQGSGAIFQLVRIAPEDPEVVAAVREFLSRPLESKTKRETLTSLGPSVKDAQIISMVISSLDDPDVGVRANAAAALEQMGGQALQQAEPALQKLASDPNQPTEVTTAAKRALQRLHPSPK